jgi:hypothetical protein
MEQYTAQISAVRTCRFCGQQREIAPEEPVTCDAGKIGESIARAIRDEMDSLGWNYGACPVCAINHRRQIYDECRADERGED